MKFQVGEIAILRGGNKGTENRKHLARGGDEVSIHRVGPFHDGTPATQPNMVGAFSVGFRADYEVHHPSGTYFFVRESDLLKRRPPIPDGVLTIFETRKRAETA